jgi:hypothetical protein
MAGIGPSAFRARAEPERRQMHLIRLLCRAAPTQVGPAYLAPSPATHVTPSIRNAEELLE